MGQNSAKSLGIATKMAAIHLGYLPSQPDGQIPSITFSHNILTKYYVSSFEALVYPRDDEDEYPYELGGELGSGHMNLLFTCNTAPFHKEHSPLHTMHNPP